MNALIICGFILLSFVFGFLVSTMACLSKLNQMEEEKATITEWLNASRKVNEQLIEQNNELMNELEDKRQNKT